MFRTDGQHRGGGAYCASDGSPPPWELPTDSLSASQCQNSIDLQRSPERALQSTVRYQDPCQLREGGALEGGWVVLFDLPGGPSAKALRRESRGRNDSESWKICGLSEPSAPPDWPHPGPDACPPKGCGPPPFRELPTERGVPNNGATTKGGAPTGYGKTVLYSLKQMLAGDRWIACRAGMREGRHKRR